MRKITQKSALPVYSIAALWLLWASFFPLYRIWHFMLVILFSVVVYISVSRLCPPKIILVKEQPKPADTGNRDADALIDAGRSRLERLNRLDEEISDEKVSAQIARIAGVCGKIFDYVEQNPKKAPQIRLFLNYYLPTTIKLLESYSRMAGQKISGENISSAMRGVEGILSTIGDAFEKQLDHLFADEALDISTDITVLEGMMDREGLTGDDFGQKPQNTQQERKQ